MIAILNYGLGNVKAFANVYRKLNIPNVIAARPEDLAASDKIILPGVGAFDHALELLDRSGMRDVLERKVLSDRTPVLGICVGMQMLAKSSEEGVKPGLGWIDGEVKKFSRSGSDEPVKTPHMGWNTIAPARDTLLMNGLGEGSRFYFLHSYYFQCKNQNNVVGVTDYFGNFASAVSSENIYGVQFHPEKSHSWGTRLLENFAKL